MPEIAKINYRKRYALAKKAAKVLELKLITSKTPINRFGGLEGMDVNHVLKISDSGAIYIITTCRNCGEGEYVYLKDNFLNSL